MSWVAAYANQTRVLIGPPLREPGDAQQKAYETYNEHAAQFRKFAAAAIDPQAAPILSGLKAAYDKADLIDRVVVEYAASLGAYRSESGTTDGDSLDVLPPDANKHAKALQAETIAHSEDLRAALTEVWTALAAAKAALADAKRGCRP